MATADVTFRSRSIRGPPWWGLPRPPAETGLPAAQAKPATLKIVGDTITEGNEQLLTISNLSGPAVMGNSVSTCTIIDDDLTRGRRRSTRRRASGVSFRRPGSTQPSDGGLAARLRVSQVDQWWPVQRGRRRAPASTARSPTTAASSLLLSGAGRQRSGPGGASNRATGTGLNDTTAPAVVLLDPVDHANHDQRTNLSYTGLIVQRCAATLRSPCGSSRTTAEHRADATIAAACRAQVGRPPAQRRLPPVCTPCRSPSRLELNTSSTTRDTDPRRGVRLRCCSNQPGTANAPKLTINAGVDAIAESRQRAGRSRHPGAVDLWSEQRDRERRLSPVRRLGASGDRRCGRHGRQLDHRDQRWTDNTTRVGVDRRGVQRTLRARHNVGQPAGSSIYGVRAVAANVALQNVAAGRRCRYRRHERYRSGASGNGRRRGRRRRKLQVAVSRRPDRASGRNGGWQRAPCGMQATQVPKAWCRTAHGPGRHGGAGGAAVRCVNGAPAAPAAAARAVAGTASGTGGANAAALGAAGTTFLQAGLVMVERAALARPGMVAVAAAPGAAALPAVAASATARTVVAKAAPVGVRPAAVPVVPVQAVAAAPSVSTSTTRR